MSSTHIVIVDDEHTKLTTALRLAQVRGKLDPARVIETYETLEAATVLLDRQDPFVLILDHNIEAAPDAELARRLWLDVPDPENPPTLYGYHFGSALRREHPFGLALPIVYFSGQFSDPQFLELVRNHGPYLPNFWVDKHELMRSGRSITDIVSELDHYFASLVSTIKSAANSIFMSEIPTPEAPPAIDLGLSMEG